MLRRSSKYRDVELNALITSAWLYTVDSDEMAHNEPSHLDPQCLPSSL